MAALSTPDSLGQWLHDVIVRSFSDPSVQAHFRKAVREEMKAALAELPRSDRDGTMSVAKAAEFACVSDATIRDWISKGKLRALMAGNRYRIRMSDLESCMSPLHASSRMDIDKEASKIVRMCRKSRSGEK